MNISHLYRAAARRIRSRVLTGALLLVAIGAAAAAAGPAAVAAPAATVAALAGTPKGSTAPPPSGQVSWSVSPASATAPQTRINFNYTAIKPGFTISDHVAVINRSSQAVSFTVYATDATGTTAQNALILLPAAQKPVDIGAWASFPHRVTRLSIIVPADKGVIEPFTIAVPRSASPGDHTGGMIASVSFQRTNSKGQVVTEDQRIAVPILMRVAGPLHAGLRVESMSAGFHGSINPFGNGSATVSYTVHNTGNVRLSGSQVVSVNGPFGDSATLKLKSLPTVLPGDSVRLTAQAGGLYPFGPMTSHVRVRPAAPTGAPLLATQMAYVTGSASLFAVPWGLVLLIIVVAAIVGGWPQLLRWRRRRFRATLDAVAENARRETERRLLGNLPKSGAEPQGKV